MKGKVKIGLNMLLMIIVLGVIFYVMDNSFSDIAGIFFVVVYQFAEGRSIKEIARYFNKDFTTVDGFFTSCYVAFYRIISFGTGTLLSEIYFYKKKGIPVSKSVGITALHMIMYKAAVIFLAIIGLIIQFSLFYENAPSSLKLQVLLVKFANRWFKRPKLRDWVDNCNLQIYSLRAAVQTITQDRSALLRIFSWNVFKLLFWYIIPYIVLVENHPNIDLLLVMSFTSFAVILSGVIPTPAGIGPFEFVYLLLFKPLVGNVDAVASVLLYRFGSFVLPFLIGLVYVAIEKRKSLRIEIEEIKRQTDE